MFWLWFLINDFFENNLWWIKLKCVFKKCLFKEFNIISNCKVIFIYFNWNIVEIMLGESKFVFYGYFESMFGCFMLYYYMEI